MPHQEQQNEALIGGSGLNAGLERIEVGEYTITHDPCGDYWIGHKSGEGMQVYKHNFERMIDDYYKSEF
jgi:hypothetical protein